MNVTAILLASVQSVGSAMVIVAIGIYMRKKRMVTAENKKVLAVFNKMISMPLFLFTKLLYCPQNGSDEPCPDIVSHIPDIWLLLIWPIVVVGIGLFAGWVLNRLVKSKHSSLVLAVTSLGNSTALPVTLLSVIHSSMPRDSELGATDPTLFLSVYLILFPVIQWSSGSYLLKPKNDTNPNDLLDPVFDDVVDDDDMESSMKSLVPPEEELEPTEEDSESDCSLGPLSSDINDSDDNVESQVSSAKNLADGREDPNASIADDDAESIESQAASSTDSFQLQTIKEQLRTSDEVFHGRHNNNSMVDDDMVSIESHADSLTDTLPHTDDDHQSNHNRNLSYGASQSRRHLLGQVSGRQPTRNLATNTGRISFGEDVTLSATRGEENVVSLFRHDEDDESEEEEEASIEGKKSFYRTLWGLFQQCFLQPPVIGAVLGITFAAIPQVRSLFVDTSTRSSKAPLQWLFDALFAVGLSAIPINMIVLGVNLAPSLSRKAWRRTHHNKDSFLSWKLMFGMLAGKMLFVPAIGMTLTWILKDFVLTIPEGIEAPFYLTLMMVCLTPTASNVMVMAELSSSNETKEGLARALALQYFLSPVILTGSVTVAVGIATDWST